jgi:hypothetical protein
VYRLHEKTQRTRAPLHATAASSLVKTLQQQVASHKYGNNTKNTRANQVSFTLCSGEKPSRYIPSRMGKNKKTTHINLASECDSFALLHQHAQKRMKKRTHAHLTSACNSFALLVCQAFQNVAPEFCGELRPGNRSHEYHALHAQKFEHTTISMCVEASTKDCVLQFFLKMYTH